MSLFIVENDSQFEIDISELGEVFTRRLRFRLESVPGILSGGKFSFPFTEENKNRVYEDIVYVLEDADLRLEASGDAADFISRKIEEEERFREFSSQAFKVRNNVNAAEGLKEFAAVIKDEMVRKPYELQLLSAYHLAFAQNACNFSVPGTGKTTVVYAAYSYLKALKLQDPKRISNLLVICPISAFGPWETEYEDCFNQKVQLKKLVGLNKSERRIYLEGLDAPCEITLVSYQTAANDEEQIKRFLSNNPNTMVVLDEAHRIKNTNEDAVWSQAILSISKYAASRVVLTGTPAPNKPSDVWNYFKFIWPDKSIISFPIGYLDEMSREADKKKFLDEISPFFMRVKKSDLKLPEPKVHEPIQIPMDEEQRKIYDYLSSKVAAELQDFSVGQDGTDILKAARMIRLRQCASNPNLLKKPLEEHFFQTGDIGVLDPEIYQLIQSYNSIPPKFYKLKDLLFDIIKKDGPDGRVVVWSNFVTNLKSMSSFLHKNGIANRLLTGEVPTETENTPKDIETRQKIVKEFHEPECEYSVILANPAAVGESISLHKACRNAVYFEKDFNAANYMQSKDRIHRYGLPKKAIVNYFFLITESSIDLDIHERVHDKERAMLGIIEKEEIPLFTAFLDEDLSNEDISAFLNGHYRRVGQNK